VRIVFLTPSGEMGGAERALLDLAASVAAAQPSWRLALVAPVDGPLTVEAAAMGIDVRVLAFPPRLEMLGDAGDSRRGRLAASLAAAVPSALRYRAALRRLLGEMRPDVIHSNGLKTHLLSALARPRGAALLWHLHDYAGTRRAMARLLRTVSRRCDQAVANSASVAADARGVLGPSVPIETLYNAVDLARFAPSGPALDLDAASGLPAASADTVRVGLVATMGVWKGHEVFLRAVARLPAGSAVRAYVVGGAIYRTAGSQVSVDGLRALAADLGIAHRVGFTDRVVDAAAAMRALDVVVHASTRPEPFGLVIAEGMACGRAVVVSLAGGAAEIVRDGVDALGFPPGDDAALASVLDRLARNPALRSSLGVAARSAAEERFDPARLARQMVPIYRRLAGEA
jgi:glycosyltransferase involved in cell wall biosynthesis